MNNLERIKNMSLDEMAAFLTDILGGESIDTSICNKCAEVNGYCMAETSGCSFPRNVNKEWLMMEVSNG